MFYIFVSIHVIEYLSKNYDSCILFNTVLSCPLSVLDMFLFILKGSDDSDGVKSILEMSPMFPFCDPFIISTLNTLTRINVNIFFHI